MARVAPISFFTCRAHVVWAGTSTRFIDEVQTEVIAGDGGNGSASVRREKFVPLDESDGSDSGRGGGVWAVADRNIDTPVDYRLVKRHLACNGENGRETDCYGTAGEDITLCIPVGTAIYDVDTEELIADLAADGQRLCLVQDGEGGWDSVHFESSTNRAPRQKTGGKASERRNLRLELKMSAGVGPLGMPSAGKSMLIMTISNTRPKIADYPFTTLHPNLGVAQTGPSRSFAVADIPGLVGGAAEGTDLGYQFLRYLQRTRVSLYMVDLVLFDESVDPVAEAKAIVGELKKYDTELFDESCWLVFNRLDMVPKDERETHVKDFVKRFKWRGPMHRISVLTHGDTQALVHAIQEYPDELRVGEDVAAAASDQYLNPGLHNVGHDNQA